MEKKKKNLFPSSGKSNPMSGSSAICTSGSFYHKGLTRLARRCFASRRSGRWSQMKFQEGTELSAASRNFGCGGDLILAVTANGQEPANCSSSEAVPRGQAGRGWEGLAHTQQRCCRHGGGARGRPGRQERTAAHRKCLETRLSFSPWVCPFWGDMEVEG